MDKEVLWERRLKICMSSMTGFVLVYAILILLFSFLFLFFCTTLQQHIIFLTPAAVY